jgi:hypothetical protein
MTNDAGGSATPTAEEFMSWPTERRYQALNASRAHLGQLLLAEIAVTLRQLLPTAAWIRVQLSNLEPDGTAALVSIRDADGHSLGKVGKNAAGRVNMLLGDLNRVWPVLLGRLDSDDLVVRVDLPVEARQPATA